MEATHSTPDAQEAQLHRLAGRWRFVLRGLFIGLAVLLWVSFVEDTSHEHRLTLDAVAGRDANLATAAEHYAVRVLGTAQAVHRLLGQQLQGHTMAQVDDMIADRLRANDLFSELGLCLAGGRVLTHARGPAQLSPARCAGLLAHTPSGAGLVVLPPIQGARGLLVPLAFPLVDARGKRVAVAVAVSPAESMLRVMQSVVLHDDTAVLVLGADGVPRAAWRSRTGHVTEAAGFAALSDLARRDVQAQIDGRPYLVSMRTDAPGGLQVKVATASDDALAAFHARRARLLALCLLVTIGLAAVYHLLSRMQRESLRRSRALFRAQRDLEQANERLDRDVQERTAQLEQAYRDLETFSYAVAHDVRAPLASIAGFAQALEAGLGAGATEKQQHYLRRIQSNAAHMDELTQHLLELGRLTRTPLERTEVDLSGLAAEVLERLRETGPARHVVTEIEQGMKAQGDRALLRQVLENLLGNAWKFSSKQAVAHITFRREPGAEGPGESVYLVQDDGQGFDSDQAPGLFQPFRRMHDREEFPGTGVGLAAVQRIVALHGGRVWAVSNRGAGARFCFSLPATAP